MMFTPPTLNYTYEAVPDLQVRVATPEKRKRNTEKSTGEGPDTAEVPARGPEERKRKGNDQDRDHDHDRSQSQEIKGIYSLTVNDTQNRHFRS